MKMVIIVATLSIKENPNLIPRVEMDILGVLFSFIQD
jgi:hypothetical protein